MARYRSSIAVLLTASITALVSGPASAYVMVNRTFVDFTNGSVSLGFGRGFGTKDITFSDNANGRFSFNPVSVSSNRFGAFGYSASFGEPFTFFDPIRGSGELTFPTDSPFASFSTPVVIPYSITPFIIGLADTTADGTHYGYAELSSTTLISYGFETVAGAPITISNLSLAAVPLPATAPLFGVAVLALGAVGYAAKRKNAAATA